MERDIHACKPVVRGESGTELKGAFTYIQHNSTQGKREREMETETEIDRYREKERERERSDDVITNM